MVSLMSGVALKEDQRDASNSSNSPNSPPSLSPPVSYETLRQQKEHNGCPASGLSPTATPSLRPNMSSQFDNSPPVSYEALRQQKDHSACPSGLSPNATPNLRSSNFPAQFGSPLPHPQPASANSSQRTFPLKSISSLLAEDGSEDGNSTIPASLPPLQREGTGTPEATGPASPPTPNSSAKGPAGPTAAPLTDEERKERNRLYAKKSRFLKNKKYLDSVEINKNLEAKVKDLQTANDKAQVWNQILQSELQLCKNRIAELEEEVKQHRAHQGLDKT